MAAFRVLTSIAPKRGMDIGAEMATSRCTYFSLSAVVPSRHQESALPSDGAVQLDQWSACPANQCGLPHLARTV